MTDSPGNKYTAGQCHNCGGYPPGPWLKQWRIDHPRSQRTPCRMRMSCTYNGKWSPEQLRTAWDYGPGGGAPASRVSSARCVDQFKPR
jgi:hypothetical protein